MLFLYQRPVTERGIDSNRFIRMATSYRFVPCFVCCVLILETQVNFHELMELSRLISRGQLLRKFYTKNHHECLDGIDNTRWWLYITIRRRSFLTLLNSMFSLHLSSMHLVANPHQPAPTVAQPK